MPRAGRAGKVPAAVCTRTIDPTRLSHAPPRAVQTGHVDPRTLDNEISPALETMIEKWGEAHTYFQQLTHPHDSSPLALSKAGWELVDAMREITATRRMPASVQDMSDRVEGESLVKSLHRFHATMTVP